MKLRSGKLTAPTGISSLDSKRRKRKSINPAKENVDSAAKLLAFKQFDVISSDPSDHHHLKNKSSSKTPTNGLQKNIMKEWKILETNLPESIYVRVYEGNINLLRAVIIGPTGTPYHDGLFFFDLLFPSDYPKVPPQVYYHAHGLRLNPNLYDNGYVCLSLLNTWNGQTVERWNPGKSTVLQVLVSIQGLVLNSEPFYNEPMYNGYKGKKYKSESKEYANKAFLLSCKTMLYLLNNPPKDFEGFVVDHFRDRGKNILAACKAYMNGDVAVGFYGVDGKGGSRSCTVKDDFKKSLGEVVQQLTKGFTNMKHNAGLEIEEGNKRKKKKMKVK